MERTFEFKRLSDQLPFTVKLTIDENELARMLAARAINNKNGKATAMDRAIQCEVIKRGA